MVLMAAITEVEVVLAVVVAVEVVIEVVVVEEEVDEEEALEMAVPILINHVSLLPCLVAAKSQTVHSSIPQELTQMQMVLQRLACLQITTSSQQLVPLEHSLHNPILTLLIQIQQINRTLLAKNHANMERSAGLSWPASHVILITRKTCPLTII